MIRLQPYMLGVSGLVPDGVAAVFLTGPDGTAVRADVQDNGYSFVVPRGRMLEPRYVVWTGSDGTPHVQPVAVFAGVDACRAGVGSGSRVSLRQARMTVARLR